MIVPWAAWRGRSLDSVLVECGNLQATSGVLRSSRDDGLMIKLSRGQQAIQYSGVCIQRRCWPRDLRSLASRHSSCTPYRFFQSLIDTGTATLRQKAVPISA